jgi:transcriptional regulator GlxA family with amidase domain
VAADNNKLWTASGVSAGTDGCLALVEHMYGEALAEQVSDAMEWTRVRGSGEDGFAGKYGVQDVLPVE